ncbi:MAG TPA: signal recognition particle subunit SRP19/SEC65 family protein [Candidatus Lokiarchaeia archaeon]|nr:signal recognition particle subunit SRP19/SEC65 family protein [Candidatus Lokiarchaeia archaeon]
MRKKSKTIYWLAYFDKRLTRAEGRRLPKNEAVEKLTIEQLATAARALGYEVDVEPMAKFPAHWFERPGRILVDTSGQPKSKVLNKIGKQLRKGQPGE